MLQIKTTGVEDYLDGSANIKALIIGGPGAGKTRMSSYWPKPIFLDCENGRGSLADRNMPYAEIKTSKDMLDALEYLKSQERVPKVERQFQTVVIDTVDSFQRLVKDEWVQQTKSASFTGYDAWGYLDTKMQMLFARLLNLDFNVLVLVHYKDKTFKDGENQVREFTLQLQGAISDIIFNDFGLVGWLGTYWAASGEGRVQKRGLTFQPTPDKPFLKDRFNVTPKWMEIEFSDNDYHQIFEAFFNRPEFEDFAEAEVVGEIPDAAKSLAASSGPVAKPVEGGPLPPADPIAAPELPLEKQTKEQLVEVAKGLGLTVKGNLLKSEILKLIKDHKAKPEPEPEAKPTEQAEDLHTPMALTKPTEKAAEPVDPTPTPSENSSDGSTPTQQNADVTNASLAQSSPTATSSAADDEQAQPMDPDEVAKALGAEVIAEEKHDTPSTQPITPPPTPAAKSASQGPSACADCQRDLGPEWADSTKKDYIRLSFVKFRRYLCTDCYAAAVK